MPNAFDLTHENSKSDLVNISNDESSQFEDYDHHEFVVSDYRYLKFHEKKGLNSNKFETKPALGIIGNSTIAAYAGGESIASLMNITSTYSIIDISVPGYTINQEDSLWRAIPTGVKRMLNYVFIEIGLNDLEPEEPAEEALLRYQSLINLVRSETNSSCRIITSTLTPCKQRLIYLYGITDGLTAYRKWLEMNAAMVGTGPDKIINFDSYCSSHTKALSDSLGNLDSSYDTGDGIHETTRARQIIADEWVEAIKTDQSKLSVLNLLRVAIWKFWLFKV